MTFAEHLPNAANVLKPKNNNMEVSTVSGRSAIAFVNYTDSANATSGRQPGDTSPLLLFEQ